MKTITFWPPHPLCYHRYVPQGKHQMILRLRRRESNQANLCPEPTGRGIDLNPLEIHIICYQLRTTADPKKKKTIHHAFLHTVLSYYLKTDKKNIRIDKSKTGKPYLTNKTDLHFSFSHSQNMVLLAVTRKTPLGIDVEKIRSVSHHKEIAKRFFSAQDCKRIFSHKIPQKQLQAFFCTWTKTEAKIKARGTSLFHAHKTDHKKNWTLKNFKINHKYIGALAIPRRQNKLCLFEWADNLLLP